MIRALLTSGSSVLPSFGFCRGHAPLQNLPPRPLLLRAPNTRDTMEAREEPSERCIAASGRITVLDGAT